MSHAKAHNTQESPRDSARREFADEQVRMRHFRKAMACVDNDALRWRWNHELEVSRGRAARLAIALLELGEPMPQAEARPDSTRCLMDAMDVALRNSDTPAAEAVAIECMRLIDMRSRRVQHHPPRIGRSDQ